MTNIACDLFMNPLTDCVVSPKTDLPHINNTGIQYTKALFQFLKVIRGGIIRPLANLDEYDFPTKYFIGLPSFHHVIFEKE